MVYMKSIRINDLKFFFLFIYMFLISFLNFTPFYLASAFIMIIITFLSVIKSKSVVLNSFFWWQFIFIVYIYSYCFFGWTVDKSLTMNSVKTLLLNFTISFSIMNIVKTKDDVKKVSKFFIPIAISSALFIIFYSKGAGVDGRIGHGLQRIFSSTNYTSMEFASWSLYASTFCNALFFKTKKSKYLYPLPLYWLIIIWAGSRKWLLFGIILQILVYLLYSNKGFSKKKIKQVFLLCVMIPIILLMFVKVPVLYNKIGYRFAGFINGTESSALSRSYYSNVAVQYIQKRPFSGYGINTFRNYNKFHNWTEINYLELLFGGGLPLVCLYYLYIISNSFKLFKLRKVDKIYGIFSLILFLIVIFDVVSMSYLGRLESLLFNMSSILIYDNKKCGDNNENN